MITVLLVFKLVEVGLYNDLKSVFGFALKVSWVFGLAILDFRFFYFFQFGLGLLDIRDDRLGSTKPFFDLFLLKLDILGLNQLRLFREATAIVYRSPLLFVT